MRKEEKSQGQRNIFLCPAPSFFLPKALYRTSEQNKMRKGSGKGKGKGRGKNREGEGGKEKGKREKRKKKKGKGKREKEKGTFFDPSLDKYVSHRAAK